MVRAFTAVSRVISFFNLSRKIGRHSLSSEDKLSPMLRIICPLKAYVSTFHIDLISFLILFFLIIFTMHIIPPKSNIYELALKNLNLILIYKKKQSKTGLL